MIVLRFRFLCLPDRTQQALAVLTALVAPSRALEGVVRFDAGRDLADPDAFFAVGLYEDDAARERQEALPAFATFLRLLPDLAAEPPEVTRFEGEPDPSL